MQGLEEVDWEEGVGFEMREEIWEGRCEDGEE